jgi:hypothetical protein
MNNLFAKYICILLFTTMTSWSQQNSCNDSTVNYHYYPVIGGPGSVNLKYYEVEVNKSNICYWKNLPMHICVDDNSFGSAFSNDNVCDGQSGGAAEAKQMLTECINEYNSSMPCTLFSDSCSGEERVSIRAITDMAFWNNKIPGQFPPSRHCPAGSFNYCSTDVDVAKKIFINATVDFIGWSYAPNKWSFEGCQKGINLPRCKNSYKSICYDFKTILMHELGHMLGLDHMNDSQDGIMFENYNGEKSKLATQEKCALCLLYCNTGFMQSCGTTTIDEDKVNLESIQISIVPMPARKEVTIKAHEEIVKIWVFNVNGKLVKDIDINYTNVVSFQVNDLSAGTYFLSIVARRGIYRKMIVIM